MQIEKSEQMVAGAQENWNGGNVQFNDTTNFDVLADGSDTALTLNILPTDQPVLRLTR